MNVLPWLLDWPPRRSTVVAFLLLTAISVGTLVAFGGVTDNASSENVTVASADLTVRLNDERDLPDTNGTVETCLASGTPSDSVTVLGDVTVDIPAEAENVSSGDRVRVLVSLAHTDETTARSITERGRTTSDVFWVFEDDETLAVGDTATVQIRVQADDATVANATRRTSVLNGSRSFDC